MKSFIHKHFYTLFLIAATFIIYFKNFIIWSSDKTYIFGDTNTYALNLAYFARNLSSIFDPKDSIYLWNPYHLFGIPMLSSIDSGLFYPPNIIIAFVARLLGNPELALPLYTLSAFIHLVVASLFVYKLLRYWHVSKFSSLLGSILWLGLGFNSEFISSAVVMMAGSYLPLAVYSIIRWEKERELSHYVFFYLYISLSFLLGYPMISMIVSLTALIFQLIYGDYSTQKSFFKFVQSHIIGFLLIILPLIAPQYLPSISLFKYSVRSSLSLESFLGNAVSPANLLQSLLPMQRYMYNQLSSVQVYLYFSLVGVIILLQSRGSIFKDKRNIWLLLLFVIALVLSLGKVTSIASLMYYLLPGINLFRRLSVFSLVPGFIFCIFVAKSFEFSIIHKNISAGTAFLIKTLFIILLIVQLINVLDLHLLIKSFDINVYYYSIGATLALSMITIMALLIFDIITLPAQILIIFVLLLELSTHTASIVSLNSKVNPSLFFKSNIITQKIQEIMKPGERANLIATQNNYSSHYLNIEQISGYVSLGSQYAAEITKLLYTQDYNPQNLKDIVGIKYTIDKVESKASNDILVRIPSMPKNEEEVFMNNPLNNQWEPEQPNTAYFIHPNDSALPRLYLAKDISTAPQTKELLKELSHYDHQSVFIDPSDSKEGNFQYQGDVTIEEYKRNYIKAVVNIPDEGFLANSTPYYSGWKVKVNGEPAKLVQTNWFMMGVYVPRGESTVEFEYSSPILFLAIVYLVGVGLIWFLFKRRLVYFLSKSV